MMDNRRGDTRERLIDAAAELIAASPGEDFSMREVCDRVGVQMPTLYHFFGSKQGLVEEVVERGFELYLAQKGSRESSGDPIQDLRDGWDQHVRFGLENPGFYTLMYGKIRPGYTPAAHAAPTEMLRAITARAEAQNRLVVDADAAAAQILATNIGVTLRQISHAEADPQLSANVRDAVVAGITGVGPLSPEDHTARDEVLRVARLAASMPDVLGDAETALLAIWLERIAERVDEG